MFKIYFRQAIYMLKQNRFLSIISILGTAVAIMMIMGIIVSEEIKSVNIAPEINRSRTLYVNSHATRDTIHRRNRNGYITYEIIHEYIPRLKHPAKKAILSTSEEKKLAVLNVEGNKDYIIAAHKITNADYWDVFQFNFIDGKPYNQNEVYSGVKHAVITENLARKLFRGDKAIGKNIEINFRIHEIVGVVEDVQPLFGHAYSEVWVPYTSDEEYKTWGYETLLMAEKEDDFPEIIAEVRECERQYGNEKAPVQLFLKGPWNRRIFNMQLQHTVGHKPSEIEGKIKENDRKRLFIICVLLLIPAINLSGLSLSRIKKRSSEIGVRKAFGAKKYVILVQVLYENFITSIIGGILGLILSYIAVFWMRDWLLGIPADSSIPIGTLVSPLIFFMVFVACIIINLLSAGLPAFKASRATIINSINQSDKES